MAANLAADGSSELLTGSIYSLTFETPGDCDVVRFAVSPWDNMTFSYTALIPTNSQISYNYSYTPSITWGLSNTSRLYIIVATDESDYISAPFKLLEGKQQTKFKSHAKTPS
jgi:hypothetical protein